MKIDYPVFFAAVTLFFAAALFIVASVIAGWPGNFLPGVWLVLALINYVLWLGDRR
ncbi:hypothetical protein [Schaalia sp. ZJ1691]|uniref:hypothetical protein n=1 Tax=Schaalia sp. ZJ1691 TaxID=2709404 RepID=UPI0013EC9933|nr:hypothetical protein [Schaalia sp. ZJ1691]